MAKEEKNKYVKAEEEVLEFWQKNKIFEKSVERDAPKGDYVFYDGPPFATGLPHHGTLLSSVIKDVVARYWTMKGYRVPRRWGWDCHGLPIENIIENDLKISGKKDIEDKIGVEKFNEACRSKVLMYTKEWKEVIDRIGRWVEFDNSYKTMDQTYIESVWWALKTIWDRGLIYEGRKVLMYCPRCETPVSKAEIAMDNSYQDVTEESLTIKFKVKNPEKHSLPENTYILAWTTTPWTLPANVALAVGKDIKYALVEKEGEHFILASELLAKVFPDDYQEKKVMIGKDLVDIEYEPLLEIPAILETGKKAWYVTDADFVSTEEGTGVVHTAVVYGEDDYNLGLEKDLPVMPLINEKGYFNEKSPKLIHGQYFKDAEKDIMDYLEKGKLIFAREDYTHPYPFCWRCNTQLFYNAISAWFINIQKVKSRLIELNEKINWYPDHLKHGRFLNILETAPDWNISRNRYWASPLPFWQCDSKECGHTVCLGSIDDLKKSGNRKITKIIFARHGESEKNVLDTRSRARDKHPLTAKGRKQVEKLAGRIDDKVDIIISSPVLRTKETAEILQKKLGSQLIFDDLLEEYNCGEWEELKPDERHEKDSYKEYKQVSSLEEKYNHRLGKTGESRKEVVERLEKFLDKVHKEQAGQVVLVVSHGGINAAINKVLEDISYEQFFVEEMIDYEDLQYFYIDENGKSLDLHKHNTDLIKLKCEKCNGTMTRVPEVVDCWVESGSMPFAELHYPFENQELFKKRYPGEFIAEYIAQTRAWFYYMHALATLLFDDISFENSVCTGTILAQKGEKLSKSKQNYTDPLVLIDQYGADSFRYYLMSSVVMQAETLFFNDDELRDVYNKVVNILNNVVSFYKMYDNGEAGSSPPRIALASLCASRSGRVEAGKQEAGKSDNVLDKWILAKLNVLVKEVTESMNKYNTVKASRPMKEFIDELSTWYLRRSRDRFKGDDEEDKQAALATTYQVLLTLSKLMAPITPFLAEKVYKDIGQPEEESVHLCQWPEVDKKQIDEKLLDSMASARQIVEAGLAARAEAGLKVRQPLNSYSTSLTKKMDKELLNIAKDELNVKEIKFGEDKLDTEITPELKQEGLLREMVRFINALRKQAGLTINDRIKIYYQTDDKNLLEVFDGFGDELKKSTLADELVNEKKDMEEKMAKTVEVEDSEVWLGLAKM